jgi:hypothetical protein
LIVTMVWSSQALQKYGLGFGPICGLPESPKFPALVD